MAMFLPFLLYLIVKNNTMCFEVIFSVHSLCISKEEEI